jgi:CRISPR-associated protein Cmr2
MDYLFLVSIGPVQDFIASARRTRDLAFGSWFLSELSRAAARAIVRQNGLSSLIFPAPTAMEMLDPNNTDFIVPNKIIALVPQSPQDLGKQVQQAVKDRLRAIRGIAYGKVHFAEGMRSIAEGQVEDLVETLWAGLPFDGQNYEQARAQLEALMNARKNTRNFRQMPPGRPVPKSSIAGQLESVIPEWAYPAPGATEEEKQRKARALYDNYGAGPAERLSGVDLLKRRGVTAYGEHFQSTSHMAALPFLERLKQILTNRHLQLAKAAWDTYIQEVRKFSQQLEYIPDHVPPHPLLGKYDGSMLLESRLVDILYVAGKDQGLQQARLALQNFYSVLDEQCKALHFAAKRPGPYYAFLQADGDEMGKIIDAQAKQSPERHQQLSRKLSEFAEQARNIVNEHRGALVYAGGDDIMAFLPLDTVLECASRLARTFRKTLQAFPDQEGQTPTLSAGIAIAHHLESLYQVRQLTKRAEERAKDVSGKDALSITLSKRSGEDYHITGHWKDLDISLPQLVDFCRKEALPAGTAYELRDLLLRLGISTDETFSSAQEQASTQYAEVIKWDALRILKRKLYVPRDKFPPKQAEEIERFFKAWLGVEQEPHVDVEQVQPMPIRDLIDALIIAGTVADAKQLAEPQKEKSRI